MYIELSSPGPVSISLIILKVKEDDGSVVRTCTATPAFLENTIEVLAMQYKTSAVVDKRFIPQVDSGDESGAL